MVQLNLALKEINCKIVYFGPGLSGKTTNLEIVHEKAPKESRGDLTSIATESDRTLFFDFMPLSLGEVNGMKTKFQLYTVPGQVYYNSTRKLVLRGADGVVFVADSGPDRMAENLESLNNLDECLREQGRSLADFPHVIQMNKRDLPDALPMADLTKALNRHGAPVVEAVASRGEGVIETFKALSTLVLERVRRMSESRSSTRRIAVQPVRGGESSGARTPEIQIPAVPVGMGSAAAATAKGGAATAGARRADRPAPPRIRPAGGGSGDLPSRTPAGPTRVISSARARKSGESSGSRPVVPMPRPGPRAAHRSGPAPYVWIILAVLAIGAAAVGAHLLGLFQESSR